MMLQKVRERIHTLPEGRHCGIVFITGTVLFLIFNAVSIAAIFAINGYCLYYGRKGGWKGTIFRTLSLFPTFFFVFCILWDGGSIAEKRYAAVLFILGLFCYYLMGKKNSWTTMDVIRAFIVIIPATFLLMFPALYLFIIFCLN